MTLKRKLKIDDSLDVFPVHGVGGTLGILLTAVFVSADFGGMGLPDGVSIAQQFGVQLAGKRPDVMAEAARVAQDKGADFVDVNLGCPVRTLCA